MKIKLSEMDYEEKGVIIKIDESLRKQVAGMGLIVGKELKMLTKQPIKGPVVVISIPDGTNTSFGLDVAEKIIMDVK